MSSTGGTEKSLDVIAIGRSSVDLYGQQSGSRLEDIASFAKSVGGCPTNISVGTARLGLRSALITRVGDEQMGRFIREQLDREGVATDGIVTDKERLTALVLLSVESEGVSPMIFVRTDCADIALDEDDIDEEFIASSASVLVSGTHLSRPNTEAAQRKAIRLAKANGGKVIFDIDYRPNLWGLAGHAEGFERYVKSDRVSQLMKSVLPDCDLIVGTEEEIMIASGADSVLASLKAIRAVSEATIVLKRGAMGCVVYDGPISDDLEDGIVGQGFPIEVYNVLGAGDAFMSGFLRGWLKGEPHATSATWANACGAFAVSRLLCAPEYPSWDELSYFLKHGSKHRALRKDEALNHIHWATNRRGEIPLLRHDLDEKCHGAIDAGDSLIHFPQLLLIPRCNLRRRRHKALIDVEIHKLQEILHHADRKSVDPCLQLYVFIRLKCRDHRISQIGNQTTPMLLRKVIQTGQHTQRQKPLVNNLPAATFHDSSAIKGQQIPTVLFQLQLLFIAAHARRRPSGSQDHLMPPQQDFLNPCLRGRRDLLL